MPVHYPYLIDPAVYPDYNRRAIKVPTWRTFGDEIQFTTLRGLPEERGRLVDIEDELELYTERFKLGRIIWPNIRTLFTDNIEDLAAEIKRRNLFLFDLWGHVPGSSNIDGWWHITPPQGTLDLLREKLGDRFLSIDNGEQDGRYVGSYVHQQCPSFSDRFRQYLNFQRHFERMGDDLGNQLSALVSLCFGHYFLREGNHCLLGAETAQALPNSQVYYSFIRGACKQYGILWFGNASCYNRWGWKAYDMSGEDFIGRTFGPESGTSLNLLKRLMYTHYLYNCVFLGFELGWITKHLPDPELISMSDIQANAVRSANNGLDCTLTPIGEIQANAVEFVEEHGKPGLMHTPVALLLDAFSGWAMPRHLYSDKIYQVWGAIPYGAGDYLAHEVLSMLYPGYEDSSYYQDERGFLTSTPYGDMADVLLSDVPLWVLKQYGLLIVSGDVSASEELKDKLRSFVEGGGELVITAANAAGLLPEIELRPGRESFVAGASVLWADGSSDVEKHAFDLCTAALPEDTEVLAKCAGKPAVVRFAVGKGSCTLLLSPFGLNSEPLLTGQVANELEQPLERSYKLLNHVQRVLDRALAAQRLFSVGEGLGYITCRKGAGEYTIGIYNNDLDFKPFGITSHCGKIDSVTELRLDQSEKGSTGYWPKEFKDNDGGISDERNIAGGDIRLFSVRVNESGLDVLPAASPEPSPQGRIITLRPKGTIQEEILARPTFFQHFDGVKIDWTYLRSRDPEQLERERGWLDRQGVRVIVDLSPGINFYPDLTLLDNFEHRYEESAAIIDGILAKMPLLGAIDAVITLHRRPENHYKDGADAYAGFVECIRSLCDRATNHGIVVYLQHHPWRSPEPGKMGGTAKTAIQFVEEVGRDNLLFALNAGHAILTGESIGEAVKQAGKRLGMVLLSTPKTDIYGQSYDAHLPLRGSGIDLALLSSLAGVPQVLDADYASQDEEYLDVRAVWR